MLIHLNTIHQPQTLDEAARLITAQVRPLYGGVALHREASRDVLAVVDLTHLGLDQHQQHGDQWHFGSMLTLEATRQACLDAQTAIPNAAFLAEMIRQEVPITLRNTLTWGDVLVERRANSALLTALLALGATVHHTNTAPIDTPLDTWLASSVATVNTTLITALSMAKGTPTTRHAYQKVARTPADAPIVGAVAVVDNGTVQLALCGVAEHPVLMPTVSLTTATLDGFLADMPLQPQGDHWGTAAYREAMGRLMARRVLERTL